LLSAAGLTAAAVGLAGALGDCVVTSVSLFTNGPTAYATAIMGHNVRC